MENKPADMKAASLTPTERKDAIIQRLGSAEVQPLDSEEAKYIVNWVSTGEGQQVSFTADEKMKIIKAINGN